MLGLSLCRLRFALMVVRQAVWRESSHRDASRQHHADTDAAAVVRRCLLSSAAACVFRFTRTCSQERHVQLARRRRVRDSADERHCVCSRLRPLAPLLLGPQLPPPLGEPASRGRQQAPKTAEDAFPDAMRTHACPKAPIAAWASWLADLIGPYGLRHGGLQNQSLPTAGNVRGDCRARRPRPEHVYVRAVCVECGTLLPVSKPLRCFGAELVCS